jgi:hypothetical protein
VIFSKTRAQEKFIEQFPESGLLIDLNQPEFSAEQLLKVLDDAGKIKHVRYLNYEAGRLKFNFDQEKIKLLNQIQNI